MPCETRRFEIRAINPHGIEVTMTIVERDGVLVLWNGLDRQRLSLPEAWTWQDIEGEIKRVSGVTRLVITRA